MPGVRLLLNDKKCKKCKHNRTVHASFNGHHTHCTMIIDTHNTPCPCKEFIETK